MALRKRLLFSLFTVTVLFSAGFANVNAQEKRALDHADVENWNLISGNAISRDGRWVLFEVGPEEKDGKLRIKSVSDETEYVIDRGDGGVFSGNSRFVAFKIVPAVDSVRTAKLAKKKGDDLPKDSLGILNLSTGSVDLFGRVLSFKLPEEGGDRIAFRLEKEKAEPDSTAADTTAVKPEEEKEEEKEEDEDDKDEGTTLVVRNHVTGSDLRFDDVSDYDFSKDGKWLVFVRSNKEGDADGLFVLREGETEPISLMTGEGNYKQLAMDEASSQIAFLSDRDDFESDQPIFTLFRAGLGDTQVSAVASQGTAGVPEGWWVSEHGNVYFSDSGDHLYFGTMPRPEPEPDDDDVLEEEKVKVDIWSWSDPLLQPMQLQQAESEKNRTYLAVLRGTAGDVIQLGTEEIPTVTVSNKGDGDVALGTSNLPYRQEISWDSPRYNDAYVINAVTGESEKILEGVQSSISLSPEGRYVFWWDGFDLVWRARSTESGEPVKLSGAIPFPVDNDLHDWPYRPNSYGYAGWTQGDTHFLFYDKYDIWAVMPHDDSAPKNVTDGVGRDRELQFRLRDLDPDEPSIDPNGDLMLAALDLDTKDAGFWTDRVTGRREPKQLIMGPYSFGFFLRKADEADVIMYNRQNFQEFPDIWTANLEFEHVKRLSNANPQQTEFSWGTAELYEWTSLDGQPLKGILYKPDGFNPSQKYAMMVYFYEKSSNGLHGHHTPRAGSSSINRSFYVSRGYVLFVPDIPYKVGYPGESAMNAVMPGITALIDEGFVDPDRIGVQGHSWGGYQIAYMVTQTNLFAAAEAGAPVSNMTSAYGGIRWGSGMSRMFQYEMTQSRIGGTLWNAQQRYIHNSPVFQADKVETPLLMMHNDEDGAVPWYQGIEFFVALRRLGQPAWLLNYNGEAHGLRKYKNRKDWTIRLQQFFDHYLKDAPIPVWLKDGIPAVKKGRTLGLELKTQPVTQQH